MDWNFQTELFTYLWVFVHKIHQIDIDKGNKYR